MGHYASEFGIMETELRKSDPSGLAKELDNADTYLRELRATIWELVGRIDPILVPEKAVEPDAGDGGVNLRSDSQVTSRVREFVEEARSMTRHLAQIMQRVDL